MCLCSKLCTYNEYPMCRNSELIEDVDISDVYYGSHNSSISAVLVSASVLRRAVRVCIFANMIIIIIVYLDA